MGDGVFLLDPDGKLAPMTVAPYETEDLLHDLVVAHPALLAGRQMRPESPRRWALVLRGTAAAAGRASGRSGVSLFVDQDAVPTLVSVRRHADERTRRETVGQALDLLANGLGQWPIAELRATYETTQRRRGVDPLLGIGTLCADSSMTLEAFFDKLRDHLDAGRIRLVFVAPEVPAELVRLTEFLSDQMSPAEVFAVDVTQYRADAYAGSVIVPCLPRHAAAVSAGPGSGAGECPDSDPIEPTTRELLDRVSELALASHFDVFETPEAVEVRTRTGDVLAVVDLVWHAFEVPLAGVPGEPADAATRVLAGLTHKKLSATTPSVPAGRVVENWDAVRSLLQRLAAARQAHIPAARPALDAASLAGRTRTVGHD
jgi:hypothetical protein